MECKFGVLQIWSAPIHRSFKIALRWAASTTFRYIPQLRGLSSRLLQERLKAGMNPSTPNLTATVETTVAHHKTYRDARDEASYMG